MEDTKFVEFYLKTEINEIIEEFKCSMKLKEFDNKKSLPIYETGDNFLDKLLLGGFRKDLVYLLYGDRKIIVDIMNSSHSSLEWISKLVMSVFPPRSFSFSNSSFSFSISSLIFIIRRLIW